MDEMKIKLSTKLMRGLVSKLLAKLIRDKIGCNVALDFSEIEVKTVDGHVSIHANVDAVISNDEFMKIVKSINVV